MAKDNRKCELPSSGGSKLNTYFVFNWQKEGHACVLKDKYIYTCDGRASSEVAFEADCSHSAMKKGKK
jgi:hypothetical protein